MKTVKDKMIKEKVRLNACQPGDRIRVDKEGFASRYSASDIVLVKIKALSKDKVQIKFRSAFIYRKNIENKILKADVDADRIVERTRKWVSSDGEDAGYYPPKVFEHQGILYEAAAVIEVPSGCGKTKEGASESLAEIMNDWHPGSKYPSGQEILPPLTASSNERFDPLADMTGVPTVGYGDPRAAALSFGIGSIFEGLGLSISSGTGRSIEVNDKPHMKTITSK